MAMNDLLLVLAALTHVALVLVLYACLLRVRKKAVARGQMRISDFIINMNETSEVTRMSRNLANQYELPVLFYFLVLLLLHWTQVTMIDVAAAWVFAISRIWHAWVHTQREDVMLRMRAFMLGYVAVIVLFAHATYAVLKGFIA